MKFKKMISSMLCILIGLNLCGCIQKNYSGEMDAVSSYTHASENCYEESLIVVANEKEIPDYEEFAWEVVDHYLNNDFESIRFSFDEQGYPYRLKATIYLHRDDIETGASIFEMIYQSETYDYNIKDNPEKCNMEIFTK